MIWASTIIIYTLTKITNQYNIWVFKKGIHSKNSQKSNSRRAAKSDRVLFYLIQYNCWLEKIEHEHSWILSKLMCIHNTSSKNIIDDEKNDKGDETDRFLRTKSIRNQQHFFWLGGQIQEIQNIHPIDILDIQIVNSAILGSDHKLLLGKISVTQTTKKPIITNKQVKLNIEKTP